MKSVQRSRVALLLLIVLNVVVALIWVRWGREPRRPSKVLLVTVDCLRQDYIDDPGKQRYTPTVQFLRAHGTAFDTAYAQSDRTSFATSCLLYSRFIGDGGGGQSLAQQLRRQGFKTGAFLSSFVMLASGRLPLSAGFETFDCPSWQSASEWRQGGATTDLALQWMQAHRSDPRWLLWVMYWDIHQATSLITAGRAGPGSYPTSYDAGAAASDAALARLLKGLADTGQDRDTLVVLTANHGFSETAQDDALTEGLLHVPLILWAPGWIGEGKRIGEPAMHVDVAPTVLSILDVPSTAPASGVPLLGTLEAKRPVYAETAEQAGRSILIDGWQLVEYVRDLVVHRSIGGVEQFVVRKRAGTRELFDVARDKGGKRDVLAGNPEIAASYGRQLAAWASRPGAVEAPAAAGPPPDPALRKKLREHGYW